jgi:hypothetical protein
MPNIKGPDGKVISFPEGTSDADIAAAFSQMGQAPAKSGFGSTALDFAKGIGEGVVNTISGADNFATKHLPAFMTTPIGQKPSAENSERATQYARDLATPTNTAQKIGKGVEQAAEFLAPTGLEKGAASLGGALLGKGGVTAGKYLGAALHSGAINKAQGGSFAGGAAAGAVGTGIGEGLQKIAPALAETALGVRAADRAYGRTPGQAILSETKGIRPGTIAGEASDKVSALTNEFEKDAAASTIPVPLQGARGVAKNAYGQAMARNNPSVIKEMENLNQQLSSRPGVTPSSGQSGWSGPYQKAPLAPTRVPIPPSVSATEAINLKRGIGDLQKSWNPATASDFSTGAIGKVYGELDRGIDAAVPSSKLLNERMSTLIPVADRAGAADLNAGVLQRVIGRAAKPTGALAGAGIGGAAGYKENGWEGAALGAGLGLFAPEFLTNPTTLMAEARAIHSPAAMKAIAAATGLGLQLNRKNKGDGKGSEE